MQRTTRREFAAGVAALGTTGSLAGCLSEVTAPIGPLAVTGTAAQVTDRRTNVIVTVENSGEQSSTAMLWARLTVGDQAYEKNRKVTVPATTEDAFTFEFPVTPRQFDYEAWIE